MSEQLDKLKRLVLQAKDLNEPFNYFFDLIEDKKITNIKGHQVIENLDGHGELLMILDVIKDQLLKHLGLNIKPFMPLFFEIPEYHFIHGACSCKELFIPITAIYFSDVKTGMFAAVKNKKTE